MSKDDESPTQDHPLLADKMLVPRFDDSSYSSETFDKVAKQDEIPNMTPAQSALSEKNIYDPRKDFLGGHSNFL